MRKLDRRHFIAAATLSPLALQTSSLAKGLAPQALAPAVAVTERTQAFLKLLEPPKRQAVAFPWDGNQWRDWNYFGASGYTKPGLRLEQMTGPQKDAAWLIFGELLSSDGVIKARNVMRLQESLVEEGDGVGQRSIDRFSVSVFGTPAATGPWGLRLEGHHLSLSFAVADGQVISVTPQAFAVRPARVTRGRHKGLVTIGPEEDLARQLMADLPPNAQQKVRVADRHLFNILSTAGRERANAKPLGLPGGDLAQVHQDLLRELVRTYATRPYAGALAAAQEARVNGMKFENVHFAWYGPNTPGRAFGYRVIGPSFVIEMGSIDSEGQHLHPVYHDLGNVLGTTG